MDKNNVKVSVIMPCYNSELTLADQLDALSQQTYQGEWELILADNGSSDATIRIAEEYKKNRLPNMDIIDASDVQGAGYARNFGVDHAEGELILFCDSDDVVKATWMEEMVIALHEHEIVAPKFEHFKLNNKRFAERRVDLQANGLITNGFNTPLEHAGASGLGIRKEVHRQIDGFDESFLFAQDWDYCWKAQLAGFTLKFVPTAVVHVRHRSSLKKWIQQAFFWGTYYTLIAKKYNRFGIEPPHLEEVIFKWKKNVSNLPKIGDQSFRDKLLWEIFHELGKIRGCFKFKTLVLYNG